MRAQNAHLQTRPPRRAFDEYPRDRFPIRETSDERSRYSPSVTVPPQGSSNFVALDNIYGARGEKGLEAVGNSRTKGSINRLREVLEREKVSGPAGRPVNKMQRQRDTVKDKPPPDPHREYLDAESSDEEEKDGKIYERNIKGFPSLSMPTPTVPLFPTSHFFRKLIPNLLENVIHVVDVVDVQ